MFERGTRWFVVLALALGIGSYASAASWTSTSDTDYWNTANWDTANVPNAAGETAFIDNGGTAIFSGGSLAYPDGIWVRNSSTLTAQGSGTLGTNNALTVNNGATVNVTGGVLQVGRFYATELGGTGPVYVNVSGGTLNAFGTINNTMYRGIVTVSGTGDLDINHNLFSGFTNQLNVSGGTMDVGGNVDLWGDASSAYNQTGGTVTIGGYATLGTGANPVGAGMVVNGSALLKVGGSLMIGNTANIDLSGALQLTGSAQSVEALSNDNSTGGGNTHMIGSLTIDNMALDLDLTDTVDNDVAGGAGAEFMVVDNLAFGGTFAGSLDGGNVYYYNLTGGSLGGYTSGDGSQFILIPEPATLIVLAAGGLLSLLKKRRR